MYTKCMLKCVRVRVRKREGEKESNLGCDVKVLMLLEQLLCVVNAGTS